MTPDAPVQSHMLNHLRTHIGCWVSWRDLGGAVYCGDPDGGPLNMRACLAIACRKLRRRGFVIEKSYSRGYRIPA